MLRAAHGRGPGLAGLGGARPHGLPRRPRPPRPAAARTSSARTRCRTPASRSPRLRALGLDEAACTAAVTRAEWPARLQRLRRGPLVEAAGPAELWLDGGHNPAAGAALAEALTRLPPRPLHLVTGMLRTKDIAGFLRPLAARARALHGVSIPGEAATLTAEETVAAARAAGFAAAQPPPASPPPSPPSPPPHPGCRILICGSLYLAGRVLRENG